MSESSIIDTMRQVVADFDAGRLHGLHCFCLECPRMRKASSTSTADQPSGEKHLHFHRTAPHLGPVLSPILRDILVKRWPVLKAATRTIRNAPLYKDDMGFLHGLQAAGVPDVDILLGIIEQDGEVAISLQ
jgi:hypothetical protein